MAFVSTFDHTNSMTDNIMNRSELQENYIQEIIDGMNYKTMERFVYDTLEVALTNYTDEELMEEVNEYCPHLLED
jgi:hypothetical protein